MFAKFDEIQALILQDIQKMKCYGRTHRQTDNVKKVYPLQTKFLVGGGINICIYTRKIVL